jgi:hypothetical protein|tara:strand:- start:764 stop:1051 length:288 start_codon:yes stop_codon:yes gene_type:complete
MTTSYITDQVDQELQLADLQNINGGFLQYLVGALGLYAADIWIEEFTGKDIKEHVDDAGRAVIGYVKDSGDPCSAGGNVKPTGDGRGCTDRNRPF